jgi:hypothetical protein
LLRNRGPVPENVAGKERKVMRRKKYATCATFPVPENIAEKEERGTQGPDPETFLRKGMSY